MTRLAFAALVLVLAGCLQAGDVSPASLSSHVVDHRTTLRITIHTAPGMDLEPQAFSDWLGVVQQVRGGEVVVETAAPLALDGDGTSDLDELYDLAETLWSSEPGVVHLPLMLVDRADERFVGGVTGTQTRGDDRRVFIAVFVGSLREATYGPLGEPPVDLPAPLPGPETLMQLERAVLVHEFGHTMGLVGCGIPEVQSRQHPQSECHSASDESVMWPAVHTSKDVRRLLLEDDLGSMWRFDDDDLADVRSAQSTLERGGQPSQD